MYLQKIAKSGNNEHMEELNEKLNILMYEGAVVSLGRSCKVLFAPSGGLSNSAPWQFLHSPLDGHKSTCNFFFEN